MRRISASIVFLAALGACTLEVDLEKPSTAGLEPIEFTVSAESRTLIEGLDIKWNKGDAVSVFDATGNRQFIAAASGRATTLAGEAVKSSQYTLLYPFSADAVLKEGRISTKLPAVQIPVPGSFDPAANLSVASAASEGDAIIFRNAGALVRLSIPENDYVITALCLESKDGSALAGNIKIDNLSAEPAVTVSEGCSKVFLKGNGRIAPGTYYICVLPGKCGGGIKISLDLDGGSVLYRQNTKPVTFTRNGIINLGTLDLSGFTYATDTPDDTSADPVSSYDSYGVKFSKLTSQPHPRLMLTGKDFEAMKERIGKAVSNDYLYIFHNKILERSLKVSRKTETLTYYIDENGNLLDVCNEALERLFSCAYLYRTTGDGSALERARKDLADVCAFKDWNPDDMMSVAEMSTGVAIAYDWLHEYLSYSEKEMIETALYEKGLVPFSKYKPREDSNWNQSTTGGAILSAIVLYEKYKTMCAATIDKCIKSNMNAVRNIFYPYGSGKEGPGYAGYTVTYEGLSLRALKTAFGTCCGIDGIEGLEKNGEWCLFMDGPCGTFNFSDASPEALEAQLPVVFLASHYNRPDLIIREKAVMKINPTYSTSRFLPAAAVWMYWADFTTEDSVFPTKHVWSCNDECPLVLARNGWKYDETDVYAAVKAASGHSSHSHLDGGEFIYDAYGYRWSSDIKMGKYAGYKNDIYAIDGSSLFTYAKQKSLRWDILCQNSYFHSTLAFTWNDGSVDKLHVTDQITDKACSVSAVIDNDSTKEYGGTVDISDHYSDAASSVLRTVTLVGKDLNVIDVITSKTDHTAPFEWRMVTKATASVDPQGRYVTLTQGDKTLFLYCISSGNVSIAPQYGYEESIVRPSSWTPRAWDSYQDYTGYHVVKFSAEVASGKKTGTFRTVISSVKPK